MLNLARLRLLQQLSVLGTISAVGESLPMTRSAVSQQLSQLERDLDTALIERVGRGVRLTPAGRRLVMRSHELFGLVEEIEAELASSRTRVSGDVRLAAFGSLAATVIPQALSKLLEEYPDLHVALTEMEPAEAVRAAATKQVELAATDDLTTLEPFIANALELRDLYTDDFYAVLPADHRLAARPWITLRDLAQDRWAVNRPATVYHDFVMSACRSSGFRPQVASSCRNTAASLELIATCGAVALLPGLALRHPDVRIVIKPVRPALHRRISMAVPRASAQRPAVAAVLAALEQASAKMA